MCDIPMQDALSKSNKDSATLGELYETLSNLTTHIHNDNMSGTEFPVTLRHIQLSTIQTLVDEISKCLTEISNEQ